MHSYHRPTNTLTRVWTEVGDGFSQNPWAGWGDRLVAIFAAASWGGGLQKRVADNRQDNSTNIGLSVSDDHVSAFFSGQTIKKTGGLHPAGCDTEYNLQ